MTQPTEKDKRLEAALTGIFGFDRREYILANKCIPAPFGCGGDAGVFSNQTSIDEYRISGMCQSCQQRTFKNGD